MSANISRIVYHVDMNSHPVSIRGMKTVLIHCSGRPGEWPGAPPLSYLRVWMNGPPPPPPPPLSEGLYPPLLCAKINATQLGSVTEPAPKSLCEEKPYEALSDMFFVPVQKLSRIKYRCCGSVLSLV